MPPSYGHVIGVTRQNTMSDFDRVCRVRDRDDTQPRIARHDICTVAGHADAKRSARAAVVTDLDRVCRVRNRYDAHSTIAGEVSVVAVDLYCIYILILLHGKVTKYLRCYRVVQRYDIEPAIVTRDVSEILPCNNFPD
jgi:hypothetical protein